MPKLNTELLTTLVKWAGQQEAHLTEEFTKLGFPEWNQGVWANQIRNGVCKTACCIAGNAVIQAGYELFWYVEDEYTEDDETFTQFTANYCGPRIQVGTDDNGKPIYGPDDTNLQYVSDVAEEVLGLTATERSALFSGSNNLGDVVFIAQAIAHNHGETLELPSRLVALSDDQLNRSESYGWDTVEQYVEDCLN